MSVGDAELLLSSIASNGIILGHGEVTCYSTLRRVFIAIMRVYDIVISYIVLLPMLSCTLLVRVC